MSDWQPTEDAPRDGRWIVLELEVGGDVIHPIVGRWRPIYSAETRCTYEWEIIDSHKGGFDAALDANDITNHYSEGRVLGWVPLPVPTPQEGE